VLRHENVIYLQIFVETCRYRGHHALPIHQ
jgi:hypothetical protein